MLGELCKVIARKARKSVCRKSESYRRSWGKGRIARTLRIAVAVAKRWTLAEQHVWSYLFRALANHNFFFITSLDSDTVVVLEG
jgi:hypothetical protein